MSDDDRIILVLVSIFLVDIVAWVILIWSMFEKDSQDKSNLRFFVMGIAVTSCVIFLAIYLSYHTTAIP